MNFTEVAVIGGGPAGLSAARSAAEAGANVTIFDRNSRLGGQLIKQTHRFFGSEKEYAGERGIRIAGILEEGVTAERITIKRNTTVLGIYEDGVITFSENGRYDKITAEKVIIATGASEKQILFENNDLPGVYGAGAVQTLMNLYGVLPGSRVLMVGAGNIGLIVSYQLLQAGVHVEAVIEASYKIGGYLVHASKLRRYGVPILTRTSIKAAVGEEEVEGAIISNVDKDFNFIEGTERQLDVDTILLATGLSPLNELIVNVGCKQRYIPELGGMTALRDESLETTVPGVYVAGDVASIEEASSAILEGIIAGTSAAIEMGFISEKAHRDREEAILRLNALRAGETGRKIREGMKKALTEREKSNVV